MPKITTNQHEVVASILDDAAASGDLAQLNHLTCAVTSRAIAIILRQAGLVDNALEAERASDAALFRAFPS